ncbi:MAG: phenylacetate--CoA ligase family protein, partial [Pyrinomonadaceae bacterium]
MGRFDALYTRLPVAAQHGAVSAYGLYWRWLRFGRGHARYVRGYRERERFTAREWAQWQQHRLREVLSGAATHVPYYRSAWGEEEKAAARAGRLSELPLLDKEPLRQSSESFLREDMRPRHRQVAHTSGSTGTPITSVRTVAEVRDSMALREARSAGWAGVSFKLPRATFSGRMVEPDPESTGPFYRFNLAERQAYLSPFHLRPETAARYVEALRRHGVRWLTGYAVSHSMLAQLILEQGLSAPRMKGVVTQSEKVTPEMRRVLEAAYGCRVYEEYSTVENAIFASECAEGRLHVSPDFSVVEILRPDGAPCEPGEVGEVVTTSLTREYQPLVRYRLGDLAVWDADVCPCGRAMPVIK